MKVGACALAFICVLMNEITIYSGTPQLSENEKILDTITITEFTPDKIHMLSNKFELNYDSFTQWCKQQKNAYGSIEFQNITHTIVIDTVLSLAVRFLKLSMRPTIATRRIKWKLHKS